jgi:monofunctional glycosyltransferase
MEGTAQVRVTKSESSLSSQPQTINDKRHSPKRRRWVRKVIILAVSVGVLYHAAFLFRIIKLKNSNPVETAFMQQRAREGLKVGRMPAHEYHWVAYDGISPSLVRAVITSEDQRFFSHRGFNWDRIKSAMVEDWEREQFSRGGSTITQQLVKNLFLSSSKNFFRKLHEALLTLEMESILSKRRILELYLNVIEWGDGIYGAEAAANHYFAKPAALLTDEESAFLCAMIPGPLTIYNPDKNPARVKERAQWILQIMETVRF